MYQKKVDQHGKIMRWRAEGLSIVQISRELGISRQRVSQIIHDNGVVPLPSRCPKREERPDICLTVKAVLDGPVSPVVMSESITGDDDNETVSQRSTTDLDETAKGFTCDTMASPEGERIDAGNHSCTGVESP
jgi:hypothetical protein